MFAWVRDEDAGESISRAMSGFGNIQKGSEERGRNMLGIHAQKGREHAKGWVEG